MCFASSLCVCVPTPGVEKIWLWLKKTGTEVRREVDRLHVVVFTPWLLLLWSNSFEMCQMCWTTWLHLGRVRLTLFWNKNKRIRIVSRFFFGVKHRTIFQHFHEKRCCKSSLYSDNIKILLNVIFRRRPLHSYSGIRPIELTLSAVFCCCCCVTG